MKRLEHSPPSAGFAGAILLARFKTSMGKSPHRWVLARRVERAQELLLHWAWSASAIALRSGFSGQSHFTTVLRPVGRARPRTVAAHPGS